MKVFTKAGASVSSHQTCSQNAPPILLYPLTYKLGFVLYFWPIVKFKSEFTRRKFTFVYKSTPNFSKLSCEKLMCLYVREYSNTPRLLTKCTVKHAMTGYLNLYHAGLLQVDVSTEVHLLFSSVDISTTNDDRTMLQLLENIATS